MKRYEASDKATEAALRAFLASEEHSVIGPIRDALRVAYEADAVVPAEQLRGAVDDLDRARRLLANAQPDFKVGIGDHRQWWDETTALLARLGGQ
jgi:hypothetical protein